MKNALSLVLGAASFLMIAPRGAAQAEAPKTFMVTVETPANGTISVDPAVPADGKVPAGTVFTVTAKPADGFALDSVYYTAPGRFGRTAYESGTPVLKVTIDQNKGLGASFIEQKALEGFTVTQDVVYAQPGVKKLKYDVYAPKGARNLPGIVIIHGGGWNANTEDIMRGLAREIVRTGRYVVASVDYRWLGTADGDKTANSMGDLIDDVYGAIAHFQEHAAAYGCDPTRIGVTGDSAGGHLAAVAINMVGMIGDGGFGVKEGVYQFKPSYVPAGKSTDQVRREITAAIRASAPSYGVFAMDATLKGEPEGVIKATSPLAHIPNVSERAVPQYLLRGSMDTLIKDADVQAYTDALKAAGQRAEYVHVEGASHAFFDWKPDARTKATFAKYGVPQAAGMVAFFDSVFYPGAVAAQPKTVP